MAVNDLVIKIGAKSDQFKDELEKIKKQTKNLESQLGSIAKISGVAFAGLSAAIGVTVKDFIKFDNELRGVKTLLNENSFGAKGLERGFKDLKKEVLDLGAKTPVSFSKLNKALFDTISAGVDAGKAIGVLDSASKLAVAGLTDVSIATDGITSALNAYQLSAEDAEIVASKFFAAQVEGKTTIEELSSFFGRAGATASAYGVSLDELLGSVSAVTTGGVKTAAAFTGLNAVLANIAKPTKEAREEAARLGIEFDSTALRSKGLEGFLDDLTNAQGFTKESIEKLFGSVQAQKIAFALTGAQADKFKKTLKSLGDTTKSVTTFQTAYNTQSQSLENQIKNLSGAFEAFRIEIGEALAPTIGDIVEVLSGFTDSLRSLDDEQKKNIASFLKWGAIIAGAIATAAAFGVAVLKISAIIGALSAAFLPATVAASAFWVAVTGPVGIAVAGIAAVTAGVVALYNVLSKDERATKSLAEINNRVDELNGRLQFAKQVAKDTGVDPNQSVAVKQIQERIDKWNKLKEAKFAATEDFGTGKLLIRPEATNVPELGPELFGLGRAEKKEIPFAPIFETEGIGEVEEVKKNDEAKTRVIDEGVKKRLAILAKEKEIRALQEQNASQEEIDLVKRDFELKEQLRQANLIQDNSLRAAEIEAIKAQQKTLSEERKLFIKQSAEEERALKAELAFLDKETRANLNQEEIDQYRELILTKKDIEDQDRKERITRQIQERNQFLKDERKFGTQFATLKKFFNSQEVQTASDTAGKLVQLQQSKNSTLKGIGKAAALTRIAINTPRGALDAYSSLAGIPIVGPALGAAAAAALIAFGAEQAGQVLAANTGGFVPSNLGVAGKDSVPSLLTPGEFVVPAKSADQVIKSAANGGESNLSTSILETISSKLDILQSPVVVNGDVLDEESFIDNIMMKIKEARENRNGEI